MTSDNVQLLGYTTNITAGNTVYTEKVILGEYISLNCIPKADQSLTIIFQFSGDGTNWDYSVTNNVSTGSNTLISSPVVGKWLRLSIQNTSITDTTFLRIYVYGTPSNSSISAQIGKIGNLDPQVRVSNLPKGIFGELATIHPTPARQYIFTRGNSGLMSTSAWTLPYTDIKGYCSLAGTTLTVGNGVVRFGNGLTPGGGPYNKAYLYGGAMRYRAGQGVEATFTAYFKQPSLMDIANDNPITQYVGIGSIDSGTNDVLDGYFFGYGDPTAGPPDQATNFGIVYINNGVRVFYPRSSWNIDKADGNYLIDSLNFDYSNILRIEYEYLGYGVVKFSVVNPSDGQFYPVHKIDRLSQLEYPTNLSDPTVGFVMLTKFEAGAFPITTDMEIGVGSFNLSIQGSQVAPTERVGGVSTVTIPGAETMIVSIRCDTTFYSLQNNYPILIDFISAACEGTKTLLIKAYVNCTLTTPSWTALNSSIAPISYDTAGTISVLGNCVGAFGLGKSDNMRLDLSPYEFTLFPGDLVTFTAQSTAASDVTIGFSARIR